RHKSEAIIRLAKAWSVAAAFELINWRGMAIRGEKSAERIKHQAERIDLAVSEIFHMRAVELHPVCIAGIHTDRLAVGTLDRRVVVEPMVGVEPAIETALKIARQAMRVA